MRTLLLILLLPIAGYSQTKDTLGELRFQMDNIYRKVNQQNDNMQAAGKELQKFQQVYRAGTSLEVASIVTGIATGILASTDIKAGITYTVAGASVLMGFAGWIIQTNAHEHIEKAGLALTGTGITYQFR